MSDIRVPARNVTEWSTPDRPGDYLPSVTRKSRQDLGHGTEISLGKLKVFIYGGSFFRWGGDISAFARWRSIEISGAPPQSFPILYPYVRLSFGFWVLYYYIMYQKEHLLLFTLLLLGVAGLSLGSIAVSMFPPFLSFRSVFFTYQQFSNN